MGIYFPTEINKVLHHSRAGEIYQLDSLWKLTEIYEKLKTLGHKIEDVSHDISQKIPKDLFLKFHTSDFVNSLYTGKDREFHIESCGVFWQPILIPAMYNRVVAVNKALDNLIKGGNTEIVIADGGHHTTPNKAYGFGPINPVGTALYNHRDSLKDKKIVILDLDVHLGNGYSFIEMPNVKIYDIWGKKIEKWEILESNENYHNYYATDIKSWNEKFSEVINEIENYKPDFLIYYAGVDVLESDRMGGIEGFTEEDLLKREIRVFEMCQKNKIKTLVTLGGGYINYHNPVEIQNQREKIVSYHVQTITKALEYVK